MIFDIDAPEGNISGDSLLEDDSTIIDLIQQRKKNLNNAEYIQDSIDTKWNRWVNRQRDNVLDYSSKLQYELAQLEKLRESVEDDISNINSSNKKKIIDIIYKYNDNAVEEYNNILSSMNTIYKSGEKIYNLIKLIQSER